MYIIQEIVEKPGVYYKDDVVIVSKSLATCINILRKWGYTQGETNKYYTRNLNDGVIREAKIIRRS